MCVRQKPRQGGDSPGIGDRRGTIGVRAPLRPAGPFAAIRCEGCGVMRGRGVGIMCVGMCGDVCGDVCGDDD